MRDRTTRPGLAGGLLAITCLLIAADTSPPADVREVVAELQPWRLLIGEWRGIGQPRRGSARDTWQEQGQVQWELKQPPCGIRWQATDSRLWKELLFTAGPRPTGPEATPLEVRVQEPDDTVRTYRGRQQGTRWVLESVTAADPPSPDVYRLTLTWLNDDRFVVLSEKRAARQTFYQRVAEVAYQRQGTKLAARDSSGPECVVTGGVGTIAVSHAGRTYYVCCTGCKEAFEQDPVAILKEWAERKEQAKARAAEKPAS